MRAEERVSSERAEQRSSPMQLHSMSRRLGAIATGRHVAPAAPAVLRLVLKDASAAGIGTATHAREFGKDERVGRAFDNRDEETGEGVADGDEGPHKAAICLELQPPSAGAAAEDAIDLAKHVGAYVVRRDAALGESAEHGAHPPRVAKDGEGAGRLLLRAAAHGRGALGVEELGSREPADEALEVMERVRALGSRVGIHEVEP